MILRRILPIIFAFFVCSSIVFSQDTDATTQVTSSDDIALILARRAQLALSSPDYRVTAGDIYTLAYLANGTPVEYTLVVDSTYRIRVSNLGIVDASNNTFTQLKSRVEAIVTNNYPLSGVQFVLKTPAEFKIYVKGEVRNTFESSAWAMDRLSSLISDSSDRLTRYTSFRDITIQSANGQAKVYDYFKAQRMGDMSQDPYLRPGDTIIFNRASRIVTVSGAVERSGTYQLQEGENLKELIENYASGFTSTADSARMEMVRVVNSLDAAGNRIFLTALDLDNNYILENSDVITVPAITQLQPIFFVEGAIATSSGAAQAPSASNRLAVSYYKGETYASVIRRNSNWFTAVSDTQNAYYIRNDERVPINLNPMLYDASYRNDVLVEENDILIIPFRQYFVTVSGAVAFPGRYPYIPDRDWEYYIALAGGFVPGRNARQSIDIINMNGNKLKKTSRIDPETVITARTNSFTYYFNQYAPVITTTLSIVSSFLSIYLVVTR